MRSEDRHWPYQEAYLTLPNLRLHPRTIHSCMLAGSTICGHVKMQNEGLRLQSRDWQTFSMQGQIILGFVGHSMATTQSAIAPGRPPKVSSGHSQIYPKVAVSRSVL